MPDETMTTLPQPRRLQSVTLAAPHIDEDRHAGGVATFPAGAIVVAMLSSNRQPCRLRLYRTPEAQTADLGRPTDQQPQGAVRADCLLDVSVVPDESHHGWESQSIPTPATVYYTLTAFGPGGHDVAVMLLCALPRASR